MRKPFVVVGLGGGRRGGLAREIGFIAIPGDTPVVNNIHINLSAHLSTAPHLIIIQWHSLLLGRINVGIFIYLYLQNSISFIITVTCQNTSCYLCTRNAGIEEQIPNFQLGKTLKYVVLFKRTLEDIEVSMFFIKCTD